MAWYRWVGWFVLAGMIVSGCRGGWFGAENTSQARHAPPPRRLSLVGIGERSCDTAERLEEEGLLVGAKEAYARADWAFRYHQRLTGEAPPLMQHARENLNRLVKITASPSHTK